MDIVVPQDLKIRVQEFTAEKGFASPSAFIRLAIENQLVLGSGITQLEDHVTASISRVRQEIQVVSAMIDVLLQMVCMLPEPGPELKETGRDRYARSQVFIAKLISGKRIKPEAIVADNGGDAEAQE